MPRKKSPSRLLTKQTYPFRHMKPGETFVMSLEGEKSLQAAINRPSVVRHYYKAKLGIVVDFKIDLNAKEIVYTVKKNPLLDQPETPADANDTPPAAASELSTVAVEAAIRAQVAEIERANNDPKTFFKSAMLSALVMNDAGRAFEIATAATKLVYPEPEPKE